MLSKNRNSNNTSKNSFLGKKTYRNYKNIEKIFYCYICFKRIQDPYCCSQCQKIACKKCLEDSLKYKSSCPYCRKTLIIQKAYFAEQVLDCLNSNENHNEETCKTHGQNSSYYCKVCKEFLCIDCLMFHNLKHQENKNSIVKITGQYNKIISELHEKLEKKAKEFKEDLNRLKEEKNKYGEYMQKKLAQQKYLISKLKIEINFHELQTEELIDNLESSINKNLEKCEELKKQFENEITATNFQNLENKKNELKNKIEEISFEKKDYNSFIYFLNKEISNDSFPNLKNDYIPDFEINNLSFNIFKNEEKTIKIFGIQFKVECNSTMVDDLFVNTDIVLKANEKNPVFSRLDVFFKLKNFNQNSNEDFHDDSIEDSNVFLVEEKFLKFGRLIPTESGISYGINYSYNKNELMKEGYVKTNGQFTVEIQLRPPSYKTLCDILIKGFGK